MAKPDPRRLLQDGARKLNVKLTVDQISIFIEYKNAIQDWNKKLNLTAVVDDEGIVVSHFLDSLTGLAVGVPAGARVVDIGAGAGLPGLALKIARPDLSLLLVEATAKKAKFLEFCARSLGLEEVEVAAGRVEVVASEPQFQESFDLAVARALAHLSTIMEYAFPFLKTGGRVLSYKGDIGKDELEAAGRAAQELGGRIEGAEVAVVPFLRGKRCLVVALKEGRTPERFPRRIGIAAKRPLGA